MITNLNEIKLLSSNLKSGVNQIVDLDKYRYISLIYASSSGEGGDEFTQVLLSYTYTFDTRLYKITKYNYCNIFYININNYKLKAEINIENNTLKIEGHIPIYVVGHNI